MPTRPGYVWDATASQWVEIGQAAVLAPVKYQATAPSSPATGDIWIESDVDVPSIDSAQFLRWRKTMVGGETSLSGNDDLSLPLAYTPGYEQLYINGVLQVRGQDYTATTGTTVTGLTALVANDVVEIFSALARTVADVYTQTQSDARFVNRNVGGLNLVVPTGATGGTVGANGAISFTNSSSVLINGCFSSTYDAYKIIIDISAASTSLAINTRLASGATINSATNYYYGGLFGRSNGTTGSFNGSAAQQWQFGGMTNAQANLWACSIDLVNPMQSQRTAIMWQQTAVDATSFYSGSVSGYHDENNQFDSIALIASSGNISGIARIYGYNNGA